MGKKSVNAVGVEDKGGRGDSCISQMMGRSAL